MVAETLLMWDSGCRTNAKLARERTRVAGSAPEIAGGMRKEHGLLCLRLAIGDVLVEQRRWRLGPALREIN
jgi:hypothetical protein